MSTELLDDLKAALSDNLVVIAGTGVSVAASGNPLIGDRHVATWPGLLEHGVDYCEQTESVMDSDDAALVRRMLQLGKKPGKTNQLITAAEQVASALQAKAPGTYRGWLKASVGKLRVSNDELPKAIAVMGGVLATLNYDRLIEDAIGREPVSWRETDKVQDILRGDRPDAVLHLHGYFEDPESVVLGLRSYDRVATDDHAATVLKLFTLDRTLVFIGCGDTVIDPNFTTLLDWASRAHRDSTHRHYLLCRSTEVERFRTMLASAPWLYPVAYGADYQDLVPFLGSLVAATSAHHPIAGGPWRHSPPIDLGVYRDTLRRRYKRLKLEDLDPTTHDIQSLTLTGMFIVQHARECVEFFSGIFELPKEVQRRLGERGELTGADEDDELLKQRRRAYLDQPPRPILDVVDDTSFPRIVLLGDPGSGKSSLLQYLALRWSDATDTAPQAIPILVELRQYGRELNEGRAPDLVEYLVRISSIPWLADQAKRRLWLSNQPILLLFDGLDEVFDPERRKELTEAIHLFADAHRNAVVVVTSRVIGYQHQAWADAGFRHFMLQELDPEQIEEFLARWHRGSYRDRHDGDAKRDRLARAIEDSQAIRELAGNPLLLTMMGILNRTQDLARVRAELYEQSARLLLHQWKVEEAFTADRHLKDASLDYQDKKALMLRIAREMQASDKGLAGNLIDEPTLERTLADGLKGIVNVGVDRAARALIRQLRGRNFMLSSVGPQSYSFVHRTFLEYFCAADLKQQFESERTLSIAALKEHVYGRHWHDDTWHETLCLLAGLVAPTFVGDIADFLLGQRDPEQTCKHVFLAARCLSEVRRRDGLEASIDATLRRLEGLIRFDLDYVYEYTSSERMKVEAIRVAAVRLIAAIRRGDPTGADWLRHHALSDEDPGVRVAAVRELARGWKSDPGTLSIVKTLAADENEDLRVRLVALDELGREWRTNPEALVILRTCVEKDAIDDVRRAALQLFVRGWKLEPDTLEYVKVLATADRDVYVRSTALRMLALSWSGNPGVLRIVRAATETPEDWRVRGRAVIELATSWATDPETLTIVKARAQHDEHGSVRAAALEQLRRWPADPETLRIVKTAAEQDLAGEVRSAAIRLLASALKSDPEALRIVKTRAEADPHYIARATAIESLARGWRTDAETLGFVKSRAEQDPDDFVRFFAVPELASAWKADPKVLRILKAWAEAGEHAVLRRMAVQELARRWKSDAETRPIVKKAAELAEDAEERVTGVVELVRGWKSEPETLQTVKARAEQDPDGKVRIFAVTALAREWRADPDTLRVVKTLTETDPDPRVRQIAMQSLARGWKDDPHTLRMVKTCVAHDDADMVRGAAVQELARGWPNDRETLEIIKTSATRDDHSVVRNMALQALALKWRDHLDTVTIVIAAAQNDEAVRADAIRLLARWWRNIPETLGIIKDRAEHDESEYVRRTAMLELSQRWRADPDVCEFLALLRTRSGADASAT